MKKILCFGDSNTFGFNPETFGRYDKNNRWSGIMSQLLENEYDVIEEGMNNRTGFFKNPEGLKQSGNEYLPVYLKNNNDFDICILSLGTNDAQIPYSMTKDVVKNGLQKLISTVKFANPKTQIIIIPPVKITQDLFKSNFALMFNTESIKNIEDTFSIYKIVSEENNCFYFDFNKITSPSKFDGIHYTKESHKLIAEALADFIRKNF